MPGLHLYRSNRVEELARGLGDLLSVPLRDALQAEWVVVQSLGMRRWLSFQIADRLGIAMNCEFPFFGDFAQKVFKAALPEEDVSTRDFSREALLWRILAAFPVLLEETDFSVLRRYVGRDEASELKRFQLARQLATLFDQYMAYMPERLLEWEAGEDAGWQPRLWRLLAAAPAVPHPPALLRRVRGAMPAELAGRPERLAIFGIASLPPFYLHLLGEVARAVEVHLFLFEPTDHFWGDVKSASEQERFLKRYGRPGQTANLLHLEAGNELLASLGRAGRAFNAAVLDLEPDSFSEHFRPPAADTLLRRLQADIYHLREAGEGEEAAPELGDGSLQIHCCHGPMRELEVLHDQLLALFEKLPGLTPKDVLVTMPDIETHAPFIEAVFGSPESDACRIPYTIADRSVRAASGAVRAYLQLLDLHGSRFTASAVLELLETRAVRERFEIDEADLETVRAWIERNRVRWGIDAAHRAEFDLPAFAQNSWRSGLDRLLLGYAWAGEGEDLFAGLLPDGDVEGNLAALLGRVAEFADQLFDLIPRLATPRPPGDWAEFLAKLLAAFFSDRGEDAEEVTNLGRALAALAEWERFHPEPVSLTVLRAYLEGVVGESSSVSGFLAGHVTFCSLKPMRSIPFRVICMLGMDDGAFPRRDAPVSFDLLAESGQTAGRSRRDEDRQLFLESLLSARDVFYLSYTGLSSKDNREAPPSVVVSELLDYVATLHPAPEASHSLVTRHRLQPFSPDYFKNDSPLFSYSSENGHAFEGTAPSTPAFAGEPLPPAKLDWRALELRQLTGFLLHPARYFMLERLGARLPEHEEGLAESEPMALDHLERWTLSHRLTKGALGGQSLEQMAGGIEATGALPAGHFGRAQLNELHRDARLLADRMAADEMGGPRPPQTLRLEGSDWALQGTLESIREGGLRLYTAWRLKPKDRLRAWVAHLLLNAAGGEDGPRKTVLFALDETLRFEPRSDATELLADLVALLREGLRRPLPFFPESSYIFAQRTLYPSNRQKKTPAAAGRDAYRQSEAADPYRERCFRHWPNPCEAEWEALSLRVWRPILTP